jgi:hypothetical protein
MVKGLSDATRVLFDDERAVANAGVVLPTVLAERLGIEGLVDRIVDLGDRNGEPGAQGDDIGVGDGARGGLHR